MTSQAFAAATQSVPFSNGTEGDAWIDKWCNYCVNDHAMHDDTGTESCGIIGEAFIGAGDPDSWRWPEAWVPEPDDGRFFLPSRLVCLAFRPCNIADCTGDPGATARADRISEVTAYWKGTGS